MKKLLALFALTVLGVSIGVNAANERGYGNRVTRDRARTERRRNAGTPYGRKNVGTPYNHRAGTPYGR